MNIEKIENILEVYSFEEVLEQNDLTEADVLYLLWEQELIEFPNPEPL